MSMNEFNCELLEISFRVPNEKFDKEAFLEITKVADKSKLAYVLSFGSTEKPKEQHAHMYVDFRGKDNVRLRITYHNFGGDEEDTSAPYMEDCAQWLSGFIKEEEISAEINAGYDFDESFSLVIALPFPLLTAKEDLAGSQVTGIRIQLPRRMNIKTAILQRGKDETSLYLDTKIKLKLKEFDLDRSYAVD